MIFSRKEANMGLGITLFVVGSVLLLQELQILPENTWLYFWPIVLLVWGLALMMDWEEAPAPVAKTDKKKAKKK